MEDGDGGAALLRCFTWGHNILMALPVSTSGLLRSFGVLTPRWWFEERSHVGEAHITSVHVSLARIWSYGKGGKGGWECSLTAC